MLRITHAEALEGRTLRLTDSEGESHDVDVSHLLRGAIFEALRSDTELFRSVMVDPELGTVVWPNGADLCPDVLLQKREPAKAAGHFKSA